VSRAGSVKKDASGRWFFIVDLTPPGGKRRQVRRRGFATKAEALDELDNVKDKVRTGTYVEPSKQTLAEFLTEWLETVKPTLRPSTHYSYSRNLRLHVFPRIGDTVLQALDAGQLNKLYAELLSPGVNRTRPKEGLSPRTVSYIATILKRALKDAVRWGRLVRSPADAADPPRKSAHKRPEMVTWSADELRAFLTSVEDDGDRDAALWRFLASTGTRRGEALGLRWADVDLDAGTATIRQTVGVVAHEPVIGQPKTAAGLRTIDLDRTTVAALREHRRRQLEERLAIGSGWKDHGLVFCGVDGDVPHPEAVSKRFDRRIRRYRLPVMPLHSLRHTWATLALRAGVHPKVVQERLGHSTVMVTLEVYSHVTAGMGRDAAEQVAALFAL
jgi:integrase